MLLLPITPQRVVNSGDLLLTEQAAVARSGVMWTHWHTSGRLDVPQDGSREAWRLEFGKTRHTAMPEPVNLWLDFPLHEQDTTGALVSARYADEAGSHHGTRRSDAEVKLFGCIHNTEGDQLEKTRQLMSW